MSFRSGPRLSPEQQQIVAALQKAGKPLTHRALYEALAKQGLTRDRVEMAVLVLKRRGIVQDGPKRGGHASFEFTDEYMLFHVERRDG